MFLFKKQEIEEERTVENLQIQFFLSFQVYSHERKTLPGGIKIYIVADFFNTS